MVLNRLFDAIETTRERANWRAAFGEPQVVGDRTLIPVAKTTYGFGLGFGRGMAPESEDAEAGTPSEGEGGGTGGFGLARPLGTIVVTPERVYFEQAVDATKIALVGCAVGALLIIQLAATLRAIFGHK
jgi:uncharacterized spore protein YtfJ